MSFRVPLGSGARNLESASGECLKISPPVFTGVEMTDEREKRIATQPPESVMHVMNKTIIRFLRSIANSYT
jgi:hypothetical protein